MAYWAVPLLRASSSQRCTEDRPCHLFDPCVRCEAETWLTEDDWRIVRFYRLVADQWVNQSPMGTDKGRPAVLTPRLEGYEAALRIHGYPRAEWPLLVSGATLLHGLVHKLQTVSWLRETGKDLSQIEPGDLIDGLS